MTISIIPTGLILVIVIGTLIPNLNAANIDYDSFYDSYLNGHMSKMYTSLSTSVSADCKREGIQPETPETMNLELKECLRPVVGKVWNKIEGYNAKHIFDDIKKDFEDSYAGNDLRSEQVDRLTIVMADLCEIVPSYWACFDPIFDFSTKCANETVTASIRLYQKYYDISLKSLCKNKGKYWVDFVEHNGGKCMPEYRQKFRETIQDTPIAKWLDFVASEASKYNGTIPRNNTQITELPNDLKAELKNSNYSKMHDIATECKLIDNINDGAARILNSCSRENASNSLRIMLNDLRSQWATTACNTSSSIFFALNPFAILFCLLLFYRTT